jgi:hypothetical protein
VSVTDSTELVTTVEPSKSSYDWILIDFLGHFSEINATIALLSDRILIPANLGKREGRRVG